MEAPAALLANVPDQVTPLMPPGRPAGTGRRLGDKSGHCRQPRYYLIASALGGEPIPPGTLSGADVRKKS